MADAVERSRPEPPDIATSFGLLLTGIGRLQTMISALPVFKETGLAPAEWVALAALHQTDRINNNQLARKLGVTRQRAHQIIAGFLDSGLISVRTSAADSRRNEIMLTAAGRAKLDIVDSEIRAFLVDALRADARSIDQTRRRIARLVRAIVDSNALPDQKAA
jgi:DNA-binding MarR family transcriptional regulator